KNRTGMNDDAIAHLRVFAKDHIRIEEAVGSHAHVMADIASGINDGSRADLSRRFDVRFRMDALGMMFPLLIDQIEYLRKRPLRIGHANEGLALRKRRAVRMLGNEDDSCFCFLQRVGVLYIMKKGN